MDQCDRWSEAAGASPRTRAARRAEWRLVAPTSKGLPVIEALVV